MSETEATGSVMKVRLLLPFIRSLWEKARTATVPNSEIRLNRFLIKLGRALSATRKRRELPDWKHMNQTLLLVAQGWCESTTIDNRCWPVLCLLTAPSLAKFLSFCTPPRWKGERDPRTLERAIARLGLVRIAKGRISHVEKNGPDIILS